MRKNIVLLLLILMFSGSVSSAVRFNQFTGLWEGNICMTNLGWGFVPFQPIGSYCFLIGMNGVKVFGMIINQ